MLQLSHRKYGLITYIMLPTNNVDHCVYFTECRLHFDRALHGSKTSSKLPLHFTDHEFLSGEFPVLGFNSIAVSLAYQ